MRLTNVPAKNHVLLHEENHDYHDQFWVIMACNMFIKYSLISKKLVAVFRMECSAIIVNILREAN